MTTIYGYMNTNKPTMIVEINLGFKLSSLSCHFPPSIENSWILPCN